MFACHLPLRSSSAYLLLLGVSIFGCSSATTPTAITPTPIIPVSYTPPSAPCVGASDYGTPAQQGALDLDAELPVNAANQATYVAAVQAGMNTRGNTVGCPGTAYTYQAATATPIPTYAQALSNWTGTHVPGILAYSTTCPDLGRTGAAYALAGYYASLSQYTLSAASQQQLNAQLAAIDAMLAAEQFTSSNVSGTLTNPGSFGYLNTSAFEQLLFHHARRQRHPGFEHQCLLHRCPQRLHLLHCRYIQGQQLSGAGSR